MLRIDHAHTPRDLDAVRGHMRAFTSWAIGLAEGSEEAPTFAGLERELAALPGGYAPPAGRLLLARLDERPVGCVALVGHDERTCELKRLYVDPAARGRGVGSRLVERLVEEAEHEGYEHMILDSHVAMTSAHAIYRSHGFEIVGAPADFPAAFVPIVVFMERLLQRRG